MARAEPALVAMREELRFERRHVDADRAIARAALARETEIERLVDLVRAPELELVAVQHLPEEMGTATRRMLLLERDHVARAHHAAARFGVPAFADPDATRRRVREAAAVGGIREVRVDLRRPVVHAETEVLSGAKCVHDLARVHLRLRIPDRLELAEGADQVVAEHLREELGS